MLETLQKAIRAPAVFIFGNDLSAKKAFTLWVEEAACRDGYTIEYQKMAFIKSFTTNIQIGLFGDTKTLLILEGITDASLPLLEPFLDVFCNQGRVLVVLSPEARKISQHFAQHKTYITCGFFKNTKDRLALFQFFFARQGESAPSVPESLFLTRDFEEHFANTCQKWWLLRSDPALQARLCAEATQMAHWDIKMLRSMEAIAAIRFLLTRSLKTLSKTEPILQLNNKGVSAPHPHAAMMHTLLDQEIAFKHKDIPPKSVLFQVFLCKQKKKLYIFHPTYILSFLRLDGYT
jgi:hypothetical protein